MGARGIFPCPIVYNGDMMLDDPNQPLYMQLADALREKIASGEWAGGSKIPTEAQLGQDFNVSRITVRRALEILVRERLLVKKRPRGTFVRPMDERTHLLMTYHRGFTEELIEQGRDPRTLDVSVEVTHANLELAERLNVHAGDHVLYLRRTRGDGEKAFVYFETWLSEVGDLPLHRDRYYGSLYALLREHGFDMKTRYEEFEAILPDEHIQEVLKVTKFTPILCRTIGASSIDDKFREYTKCYYIGSEYLYRFDYR